MPSMTSARASRTLTTRFDEAKYHVGSTNVQKRVYQEFGDRSLVEKRRPRVMGNGRSLV